MPRTPRRLTAAAACALVALVAAGCGSSDDGLVPLSEQTSAPAASASASASASPEAAGDLEQQHVDEAKALITAYYDDLGALGNDGYSHTARMRGYWSDPQLWAERVATYDQRRQDGWTADGRTEIVSVDVVEYRPDPTGNSLEQVRLDVCGDVSTMTMLDSDGAELARAADVPDRYVTQYVIQHQGADSSWTISDLDADTSRPC